MKVCRRFDNCQFPWKCSHSFDFSLHAMSVLSSFIVENIQCVEFVNCMYVSLFIVALCTDCCLGNSAGRLSQSRRVSQTKVVRFGDTCQVSSNYCTSSNQIYFHTVCCAIHAACVEFRHISGRGYNMNCIVSMPLR